MVELLSPTNDGSGMCLSREHLAERFRLLDSELAELKASGSAEEDLWLAIEARTQIHTSSISDTDRHWWWQQLYDLTERHGLTDLCRSGSD